MKALVEGKGAFSAGSQWAHFGMKLLGSRAVCRAQFMSLQKDAKGNEEETEKKMEERRKMMSAAHAAMTVFRGDPKEMRKGNWVDIIKFLLPQYNKTIAPSKFNGVKKVKDKLEEFENKKGKPWADLLEEELRVSTSELSAVSEQAAAAVAASAEGNFTSASLHLDSDSGTDDDAHGDGESAVGTKTGV